MNTWQMHEARDQLSEVVRRALNDGAQSITLRGEPVAVLISQAEYARLGRPQPGFLEFMRSSPLADVDLNTGREQTLTREVEF